MASSALVVGSAEDIYSGGKIGDGAPAQPNLDSPDRCEVLGKPPGLEMPAHLVATPPRAWQDVLSKDSGNMAMSELLASIASIREEASHNAAQAYVKEVEKLWHQAEGKMAYFEQQQGKAVERLEDELRSCREKNKRLEEEKEALNQSLAGLQAKMASMEGVLGRLQFGMPGMPQPNWLMPQQLPPSGPAPLPGTATLPGSPGFPHLPSFPLPAFPSLKSPDRDTEAKEAALCASPQPHLAATQPHLCASPQPNLQPPWLQSQQQESSLPCSPQQAATPQRRRAATPGCAPQHGGRARTPPRTPKRTSMGSLTGTPGLKSPAVPASPFVICEGGGCVFGFMLRLADGVEVGLNLERDDDKQGLRVTGVIPGGGIEAWNRQCVGGPAAGKAVMPGDRIVAVNDASDAESMLKECKTLRMLRFTVVRGEPDCSTAIWRGSREVGRSSRVSSAVETDGDFPPFGSPGMRASAAEFVLGRSPGL